MFCIKFASKKNLCICRGFLTYHSQKTNYFLELFLEEELLLAQLEELFLEDEEEHFLLQEPDNCSIAIAQC